METEIRQIKQHLRMAMNGIVSSSMREKGVNYRVNFGLTAPLIKRIADTHDKRADLAEYLWNLKYWRHCFIRRTSLRKQ